MAADLHIHAFVGLTEDDLRVFFANTLGSKYFHPKSIGEQDQQEEQRAYDRIQSCPTVWIGEVSWLKAAVFEDADRYVPDPVNAISDAIGEDLPVLDEVLRAKLLEALALPNGTAYSITTVDKLREWLDQHMGQRLFTVSW